MEGVEMDMDMIKRGKYIFLLTVLCLSAFGCGSFFKKEDLENPEDLASQVIGVASQQANLKMLVAYVDDKQYEGNKFERLKLINDSDLVSPTQYGQMLGKDGYSYKYLGRTFAAPDSYTSFVVPMYEYFIPIDYPISGFNYSRFLCVAGERGDCPSYAYVPNRDTIAYLGSYQDYGSGIVPLYQYSAPGGYGSGGDGAVSFTVNPVVFQSIAQSTGIRVYWKIVGYIYHGTTRDCELGRSPWCGQRIR